jgi:hypothetical protein
MVPTATTGLNRYSLPSRRHIGQPLDHTRRRAVRSSVELPAPKAQGCLMASTTNSIRTVQRRHHAQIHH